MERTEPQRKAIRHLWIQYRDNGWNLSESDYLGFRLPSSIGVLKDEANPYRSKLLEETEEDPTLWFVVVNAKWKYMTRRERAAMVFGYALGYIPGLLLFWDGWWAIKYSWTLIF